MGLFETIGTNVGNIMSSRKNVDEARKLRKQNMGYVDSMDFTPVYAQNLMANNGAYKKTESPLADSYLESILMGTNPNMVFSGSPNAASVKQGMASQRDQQFGAPSDLLARQRKLQSTNPYTNITPDQTLGADGKPRVPGKQNYEAGYKPLSSLGISEDEHKRLVDAGLLTEDQFRNAPDVGGGQGAKRSSGETPEQTYQKGYRAMLDALDRGDVEGARKIKIQMEGSNFLYATAGADSY